MPNSMLPSDGSGIQAIRLPANQARELIAAHQNALRDNARIELDPTFPARFVECFADSPFLTDDETLPALIALFDHLRARAPESVSDEALLRTMRGTFDSRAQGCVSLLADMLSGEL